jgi:hypothetical protein
MAFTDRLGFLYEDGASRQRMLKWQKIVFLALMEFTKAQPGKVTNIQYTALMSDAVSAIRTAYDTIVMNAPEDLEQLSSAILNSSVTESDRHQQRAMSPLATEQMLYRLTRLLLNTVSYLKFSGRERLVDTKTGS